MIIVSSPLYSIIYLVGRFFFLLIVTAMTIMRTMRSNSPPPSATIPIKSVEVYQDGRSYSNTNEIDT